MGEQMTMLNCKKMELTIDDPVAPVRSRVGRQRGRAEPRERAPDRRDEHRGGAAADRGAGGADPQTGGAAGAGRRGGRQGAHQQPQPEPTGAGAAPPRDRGAQETGGGDAAEDRGGGGDHGHRHQHFHHAAAGGGPQDAEVGVAAGPVAYMVFRILYVSQ